MSKLIESPHFTAVETMFGVGMMNKVNAQACHSARSSETGDRRDSFLLSCGLVCYLGALGGLPYLGGLGAFMQISDRQICTKWNYNGCSGVRVRRKHCSGFQAPCWIAWTSW